MVLYNDPGDADSVFPVALPTPARAGRVAGKSGMNIGTKERCAMDKEKQKNPEADDRVKDQELDQVAGGWYTPSPTCPRCEQVFQDSTELLRHNCEGPKNGDWTDFGDIPRDRPLFG